MAIDNALAGIAVKDFVKAKAWYENLLERQADLLPPEMTDLAEWHSPGAEACSYSRTRRAPGALAVSDLEAQLTALRASGVRIGKTTETKAVKTAIDEEGNQIVFAQALGGAVASWRSLSMGPGWARLRAARRNIPGACAVR